MPITGLPAKSFSQLLGNQQASTAQADGQRVEAREKGSSKDRVEKDDRERDKNEADAFLRAAEIRAKYGTQVDMNALKMIIERQRIQATEKQNMEKLALEKISRAAKKAARIQMTMT